ncbi:MAG: hypothetical protein WC796_04945 [Candidatus Pacearchaeota archaeon]|jgi:hypothetical protein
MKRKKVAVCGPREISKEDLITCRNLGSELSFKLGPGWDLITGGTSGAPGEVVADCHAGDYRSPRTIAFVPFSNRREHNRFIDDWKQKTDEVECGLGEEVWRNKKTREIVKYPVCPFHERDFYDKVYYAPRIKSTGSLRGDLEIKAIQRIAPMIGASNLVVGFINPQAINTWTEIEIATKFDLPIVLLIPEIYGSNREIIENTGRLNEETKGRLKVYSDPKEVAEFLRKYYGGIN